MKHYNEGEIRNRLRLQTSPADRGTIPQGFSQKAFEHAQKLGVIQQYVSKLETGRGNITIDTLKRIADVLHKNFVIKLV